MYFLAVFFSFVALFSGISACASTHLAKHNHNQERSSTLFFDAQFITNAMPLTTGKPYVILTACPGNELFDENIRIESFRTIGEHGSWETTIFDDTTFRGKGSTELINVARNFDFEMAPVKRVEVVVEFECGKKDTLVISRVRSMVVY